MPSHLPTYEFPPIVSVLHSVRSSSAPDVMGGLFLLTFVSTLSLESAASTEILSAQGCSCHVFYVPSESQEVIG